MLHRRTGTEAAYEFLDDRDTIIIDDASTSFYLAQEIRIIREKRIAVVTNSLIAGNELRESDIWGVHDRRICNPGISLPRWEMWQFRNMSKFHVDKAFIGCTVLISMWDLHRLPPQMEVKKGDHEGGRKYMYWQTAVSLAEAICL